MKLIIPFALIVCGALCGVHIFKRYKQRTESLEKCELMLERTELILSLEKPATDELFSRLDKMIRLDLIKKTAEGLRHGGDFPTVFKTALSESRDMLNPQDKAILSRLSDLIGAYELEKQISGICAVKSLIRNQLEASKEALEKEGQTVRSLCILFGIAAAIIIA